MDYEALFMEKLESLFPGLTAHLLMLPHRDGAELLDNLLMREIPNLTPFSIIHANYSGTHELRLHYTNEDGTQPFGERGKWMNASTMIGNISSRHQKAIKATALPWRNGKPATWALTQVRPILLKAHRKLRLAVGISENFNAQWPAVVTTTIQEAHDPLVTLLRSNDNYSSTPLTTIYVLGTGPYAGIIQAVPLAAITKVLDDHLMLTPAWAEAQLKHDAKARILLGHIAEQSASGSAWTLPDLPRWTAPPKKGKSPRKEPKTPHSALQTQDEASEDAPTEAAAD